MESIFGGNLLSYAENRQIVMELLGLVGHKPFDCVGSPDEVAAALWLCHTQGRFGDTDTDRIFADQVLPGIQQPERLVEQLLNPADEHRIPAPWLKLLQDYLADG